MLFANKYWVGFFQSLRITPIKAFFYFHLLALNVKNSNRCYFFWVMIKCLGFHHLPTFDRTFKLVCPSIALYINLVEQPPKTPTFKKSNSWHPPTSIYKSMDFTQFFNWRKVKITLLLNSIDCKQKEQLLKLTNILPLKSLYLKSIDRVFWQKRRWSWN